MANAFGLGDMASMGVPGANPAQGAGLLETLELVRKAWGSFALPPGLTPTLDPVEIERRIVELRSIEQWLAMNLTMLRGTIQAFEIQQSTLSTLRSIGESSAAALTAAAAAAQTGFPPGPPDEAGIADLDEVREAPAAGPAADTRREAQTGEAAGGEEGDASEPGAMPFAAFAGGTDPLAWWDMLQKQFGLVANAAMASIPVPGSVPGMPAAGMPGSSATQGQAQPAGQSADAGTGAAGRARSTAGRKSGAGSDATRSESSTSGSRAAASRASGAGAATSSASGTRTTKSSAGAPAAGSPAAGSPAAGSSGRSTASGGRRRSTRSG